jgi:hypothetical protein
MDSREVAPADRGRQVASAAEVIALFNQLAKHGYSDRHPGDDEESQQFAADVLELNPDWQPERDSPRSRRLRQRP